MSKSNNTCGVWKPTNSRFYYCSVRVGGTRHNASTRCTNKQDAVAFARRWKTDLLRKAEETAANPGGAMTFLEAIDRYMSEHGDTLGNARDYENFFDWMLDRIGEQTTLAEITDDVVARLIYERRQQPRWGREGGRTLAPTYVQRCIVVPLSALFTRARTIWGVGLPREPHWSKHRVPPKGRVRSMTFAEEGAILDAAGDLAPLIKFKVLTGLRRRDAIIKWSNVDFDARVIRVKAKGGKHREIGLTPDILKLLKGINDPDPEHVWMFTPENGARAGKRVPVTYRDFAYYFRRACRRAGITDLTPHDLRRTAGERMYRATGDFGAACELLGNVSIEMTRRHYIHIKADDVVERQIAMEYARAEMLRRRQGPDKPDPVDPINPPLDI